MAWENHNLNLAAPFYTFLHSSYIKSFNPLKKKRDFQNIFGISFYKSPWCLQNPQWCGTKNYLQLLDTVHTNTYDTSGFS